MNGLDLDRIPKIPKKPQKPPRLSATSRDLLIPKKPVLKRKPPRTPSPNPNSNGSQTCKSGESSSSAQPTQKRRLLRKELASDEDDDDDDDDDDKNDILNTNVEVTGNDSMDEDEDIDVKESKSSPPRHENGHSKPSRRITDSSSDEDSDADTSSRKLTSSGNASPPSNGSGHRSRVERAEKDRATTKILPLGHKTGSGADSHSKKKRSRSAAGMDVDENGYAKWGEDEEPASKRKKKPPKVRTCVMCNAELDKDNLGKYCGDDCRKAGRKQLTEQNRQKRAEKKKLEEEKKEQERIKSEKRGKQKIRTNAARKFGGIFKDPQAGGNLERRIFKMCNNEINDQYHKKVKELAYNLEKNEELLQQVLSGKISLKQLSSMSNEQLAPKRLAEERKQRDEQFKKENTLQKPMMFGMVADGKTFVAETDDKYHAKDDEDDELMHELTQLTGAGAAHSSNSHNHTKGAKNGTANNGNGNTPLSSTPSTVSSADSMAKPTPNQSPPIAPNGNKSHSQSPASPLHHAPNATAVIEKDHNLAHNHRSVVRLKEENEQKEKRQHSKKAQVMESVHQDSTFDALQMTALLKSCKSQIKKIVRKPVEEDAPLQIERDSSDEEGEEEEEEVEEIQMVEPPPPPADFSYGSKPNREQSSSSKPPPPSNNNNHHKSKPKLAPSSNSAPTPSKNVWNGTVRKSSTDKPFNLSLHYVGGKDIKLKSVIPKSLQINGRTKFQDISSCLADMSKVTRSKFTIIVTAKCDVTQFQDKNQYEQIINECRASKKGFIVDMKKTKAKIKLTFLPSFRTPHRDPLFDIDSLQKLWKCALPRSNDLWALLTVYAKDDTAASSSHHTPSRDKEKSISKPDAANQKQSNSNSEHAHKNGTDSSQHREEGKLAKAENHAKVQEDVHRHRSEKRKNQSKSNSHSRSRSRSRSNRRSGRHSGSDQERHSDRERDRERERHRERDRDRRRERDRDREQRDRKDRKTERDRDRHRSSHNKDEKHHSRHSEKHRSENEKEKDRERSHHHRDTESERQRRKEREHSDKHEKSTSDSK